MNKTLKQKEKELNGKRYKIITMSIEKQRKEGGIVPYEMEIDLHHSWMETMSGIRKDFGLKNKNGI